MTVQTVEIKSIKAQRSWAFGPSIHATFQVQGSFIIGIKLKYTETFGCTIVGEKFHDEIFKWIESYLKKEKCAPLPLDFSPLSPFTKKGLKAIAKIPIGEVASYGEIASRAGCPNGARAIGNVCNKNPYPLVIPCHRVIQGNGSIGGFAYNLKMKQSLLDFEN